MGMLHTGLTGLIAARYHLDTTSHNIANANTAGYNRQRVVQTTQFPEFAGFGYVGRGALLVSAQRAYDEFLQSSLVSATSRQSRAQHYQELVAPLNNLVADPDAGLSPALQQFFDAVQEVADNPESTAARQSMLSQGEVLTARFRLFASRMEEIGRDVEQRLTLVAEEVTQFAKRIAELNEKILQASSRGDEAPPNDLLDQREELARQLSELVGIKTIIDDKGLMSVFIGSGQTLVQGVGSATLATVQGPGDPQRLRLTYQVGTGPAQLMPESLISGGELGALLAFRREALDRMKDQLGFLGASLALAFNEQHRLGFGLNGSTNLDFFSGVPATQSFTGSQGNSLSVAWALPLNVAQFRPDAYEVRYDGANYTVTRLSDQSNIFTGAAFPPSLEGLAISGTLAAGERVVLRPYEAIARQLGVALTQPVQIAAAAQNPTTLNGTGPGDNENAQELAQLQITKTLFADTGGNATTTFQTAWSSAVAELGSLVRGVHVETSASKALLDQVKAMRDGYAGVNLDEEAANLIQFQQLYQAASKTMQIAQKMFEEVLALAR